MFCLLNISDQSFPLFTIYSEDGDEQLSITVGREVSLYYEDEEEKPVEGNYINFGISAADNG